MGHCKDAVVLVLKCLHPASIKSSWLTVRAMTWKQRVVALAKLQWRFLLALLHILFTVLWLVPGKGKVQDKTGLVYEANMKKRSI